jgi:hypothetical protein
MFCTNCGIEVSQEQWFCESCGQPVGGGPVTSPAAPQIPLPATSGQPSPRTLPPTSLPRSSSSWGTRAFVATAVVLIILGLAAVVLVGTILSKRGAKLPPAHKSPAVDVRNAKYLLSDFHQGYLQAKDGHYEDKNAPLYVDVTDLVATGDLNGDGIDEAAVILVVNTGGSATGYELYLFDPLSQRFLSSRGIGANVNINKMTISNGAIHLDLMEHSRTDPECCPSVHITRHLRLSGTALSEEPSSAALPKEWEHPGKPEKGVLPLPDTGLSTALSTGTEPQEGPHPGSLESQLDWVKTLHGVKKVEFGSDSVSLLMREFIGIENLKAIAVAGQKSTGREFTAKVLYCGPDLYNTGADCGNEFSTCEAVATSGGGVDCDCGNRHAVLKHWALQVMGPNAVVENNLVFMVTPNLHYTDGERALFYHCSQQISGMLEMVFPGQDNEFYIEIWSSRTRKVVGEIRVVRGQGYYRDR